MVALLEETDRAVVTDVCRRSGWDVSFAESCAEARALLERVKAQIVFMDRDLAGTDWRDAMTSLAGLRAQPCIVLISRVLDVYLWYEVVRYGGYEILAKPLRADEVSRVVRLAWSYQNSSY